MHRFLHAHDLKQGEELILSPDESHHLARVLRLKAGDSVLIINGRGAVAQAKIVDPSPKGARVKILSIESHLESPRVHLVFGISKPTALDFTVRRVGELGVASFTPLVTQHSSPAKNFNHERWSKIVGEVTKQCEAPFLPTLHEPVKFEHWLAHRRADIGIVVCDEGARGKTFTPPASPREWYLLLGAEGGWSDSERGVFTSLQAHYLGLGSTRLRTETAALTATLLLKSRLGEL